MMMFHLVYGIALLIISIWVWIDSGFEELLEMWCLGISLWLPMVLTPVVFFSIKEKTIMKKLPLLAFAVIILILIHWFMYNDAQSKYILMMNFLIVLGTIIYILWLKPKK